MKTSFSDADKTDQRVTTVTDNKPAIPDSFFTNADVEGEIEKSDIRMPRLSLVAITGDLSAQFPPGNFVYNKEVDLGNKDVKITLLHLKTYALEAIPFDPSGNGPRARFFATQEEARAAGFLHINDSYKMSKEEKVGLNFFKPVVDADVLIEGKATPAYESFPFEFEGIPHAIARWTLHSSAFTRAGKEFLTAATYTMKNNLQGKYYMISSSRELLNNNWTWVPKARIVGKNSDAFQKWISDIVR